MSAGVQKGGGRMSDMDTLAADIRAVLALLDVDDENTIRMPALIAFHNNAEGWLRALLDENERLQTAVEAARAFSTAIGDATYTNINWNTYATYNALGALRDALAAYERKSAGE